MTHAEIAGHIWSVCNLLRGPYKRNEYRKVILPLTVLRRFDSLLDNDRAEVVRIYKANQDLPEAKRKSPTFMQALLENASSAKFYNIAPFAFLPPVDESGSRLDGFAGLLDDSDKVAENLTAFIDGFSPNVRQIMERFRFAEQIERMHEKGLLFEVVKAFSNIDLSYRRVDNVAMGYVFEELIRIGAEQSNEEAGEHFTPREVIRLMVNLLLDPEDDLGRSHVVKTIYDPACGTGGMLSAAEEYLRAHNAEAQPKLYGQDLNDEAWAVCKSDMLIKGANAEHIKRGDSFTHDYYGEYAAPEDPTVFDYMLANPPFGVEWKQQRKKIKSEHDNRGFEGRFGAGLPRINDGSLLFLQHMISKMQPVEDGGSRIGIVFNGSPLFTGDAGSGESEIRRWILENDWLEAVVALPDQLFYNTGISTYIWILTNRKAPERQGRVLLLDARGFYAKMRKSLGNKRNVITDEQIEALTHLYGETKMLPATDTPAKRHTWSAPVPMHDKGAGTEAVVAKLLPNEAFGFHKITVERPLRENYAATPERLERLERETSFQNIARSRKREGSPGYRAEVEAGRLRQQQLRTFTRELTEVTDGETYRDPVRFTAALKTLAKGRRIKLATAERKAILSALAERDATATIQTDRKGHPLPDPGLRDTENVPLAEDVADYFAREVEPHVPDAWIDASKTKIGYEIPFNRHFYVYEPPRALPEIESDLKALESEIVALLAETTGGWDEGENSDGTASQTTTRA